MGAWLELSKYITYMWSWLYRDLCQVGSVMFPVFWEKLFRGQWKSVCVMLCVQFFSLQSVLLVGTFFQELHLVNSIVLFYKLTNIYQHCYSASLAFRALSVYYHINSF